jgi:hypothetical protein
MSQAGEMQPVGTFSPSDTEERDKRFNNPVWGRELGEAIGKELAYVQLARFSTEVKGKGGELIKMLDKAMKDCGFHKHYDLEKHIF